MLVVPSGVRAGTSATTAGSPGPRRAAVASTTGAQYAAGRGPSGTFSGANAALGEGGSAGSGTDDPGDAPMATTAIAAAISTAANARATPRPLRRLDRMTLTRCTWAAAFPSSSAPT